MINKMSIKEKVISILTSINAKIADDLDADLLEKGYVDSYEIVNLVMELEDEFNIEIDPEEIIPENFKWINAIVQLVEKNM